MQTLGLIFIIAGASGLALVALQAMAPSLTRRPRAQPIRIAEKNLLEAADLTPKLEEPAVWKPAPLRNVQPAPRVVDELFSELFALRAEVGSVTQELRTLREQLDQSGLLASDEGPASRPGRFRRVA